MASINKLSVRGVRSFSPEDVEQVLEFYFPITVIVGANGCGKTTIIESLKYAITGGLPPGARAGQSFIHDARSIGQSVVKANVKLRFTSKAGQPMVVVRSMELTQKKTTSTFKQLDGVLRTMDPRTGERQSLSHKCSELDRQVPQLMGVSKAILDSVLFCHQEDSSWPLQEGAVLKKRFDEIFDSTRYTKAVEVLRKKEKDYLSKAKDLKADLAGLNSHKHAAQGFRNELEGLNEVLEELDDTKQQIQQQLTAVDQEMAQYTAVMDQVEQLESEMESRKNELHQQQLVITKQRDMLEKDLTRQHNMAELQSMLRDFDGTVVHKEVEKLQALQQRQEQLVQDMEQLRQQERDVHRVAAKLQLERDEQDKRLRQRYGLMEHIAQTHTLDLDFTQNTETDQSFTVASLAMSTAARGGGGGSGGHSQDSSLVSISPEDMHSFMETVEKKEQELNSRLAEQRERNKAAEQEYFASLGALKSKLDIINNDLKRLEDQKRDYHNEHTELSRTSTSTSRLRKTDVEEARKKADTFAKQRDEANNDPRKNDIQVEIRQLEEKIGMLKLRIEDDKILLDTLRMSSDAQHNIALLKEQSAKELDILEDALRDQAATLQKFNIPLINWTSLDGDDMGLELQAAVQTVYDSVQSKYDDAHAALSRAAENLTRTQQIVSEKTALLASSQQSMAMLKNKVEGLSGSVNKVRKVVQDLRRHESNFGLNVRINEENPRELVTYLDKRLATIEEDAPVENSSLAIKSIMKRLKQMAQIRDNSVEGYHFECPCCKRGFNTDEASPDYLRDVQLFQDTMTFLGSEQSPLLKVDPRYQETKANYLAWKEIVISCMDDLRDFNRMNQEMSDVEKENMSLLDDVAHFQTKLRNHKSEKIDLEMADEELRVLLDLAKRWVEDAGKISDKRMHVVQQQKDLSASHDDTGRDFKTVEKDYNRLLEEKDEFSSKITSLQREQQNLMNRAQNLATQASRMEQLAREKEEKFALERKNADRKAELFELLKNIAADEKKLQEQIAPLNKKISSKEVEHKRARSLGEDEENKLTELISAFNTEAKELRKLSKQIEDYEISGAQHEQDKITAKVATIRAQITKKQEEVQDLQPRLEEAKTAVNDQERHKKNLIQNISILEAEKRIVELNNDLEKFKDRCAAIEGYDTVFDKHAAAQKRKTELQESKFRSEGRWSEVVEQIRSLKRKLMAPEYKNVDEEYRKAMIMYETTTIAAEDLKKYYSAVDKALLLFHGIKIAEINKIIRELWLMTYKGEDISNIEIVSGQEPGSRAQKSYNYRVVMTKGSAQMDMRGRCSAGQRVLASIVIRLALAETFGVNCGCIALDEPTVNLDYRNKKGLAIALAQIVAARAQQRNFQLIMITHDEEFVAMMKTELSSLTGFSMPEKYFQVRREQGIDGKYYSKIDAVDWDELV